MNKHKKVLKTKKVVKRKRKKPIEIDTDLANKQYEENEIAFNVT